MAGLQSTKRFEKEEPSIAFHSGVGSTEAGNFFLYSSLNEREAWRDIGKERDASKTSLMKDNASSERNEGMVSVTRDTPGTLEGLAYSEREEPDRENEKGSGPCAIGKSQQKKKIQNILVIPSNGDSCDYYVRHF